MSRLSTTILVTILATIATACTANDGEPKDSTAGTDGTTIDPTTTPPIDTDTTPTPTGTDTGTPGGTWPVPACVDDTFEPLVVTWLFDQVDDNGVIHRSYVPANAQALMFVFHGGGGSATSTNSLHYERLYKIFSDVGIGFLISDSMDRQVKEWDRSTRDPTQNDDFIHLTALRDDLITKGEITASTPIYAWGFSNGGGFTNHFVDMAQQVGWPIRGAMIHNANWSTVIDIPTLFTTSENDDRSGANSGSASAQVAAGYESSYTLTLEHPFYADEMMIHPGYDEPLAQDIFDEMVTMGLIDAKGTRLANVAQVDSVMSNYVATTIYGGASRVEVEIRVAWATHRPTSELGCEERDFMLSHL